MKFKNNSYFRPHISHIVDLNLCTVSNIMQIAFGRNYCNEQKLKYSASLWPVLKGVSTLCGVAILVELEISHLLSDKEPQQNPFPLSLMMSKSFQLESHTKN